MAQALLEATCIIRTYVMTLYYSALSRVYTGPLIWIRIQITVCIAKCNRSGFNPDSDHLLYMDCNPDSNPDSNPGPV